VADFSRLCPCIGTLLSVILQCFVINNLNLTITNCGYFCISVTVSAEKVTLLLQFVSHLFYLLANLLNKLFMNYGNEILGRSYRVPIYPSKYLNFFPKLQGLKNT